MIETNMKVVRRSSEKPRSGDVLALRRLATVE